MYKLTACMTACTLEDCSLFAGFTNIQSPTKLNEISGQA